MKEVKNDKQNAIIGIEQIDVEGITISIVKNGIVKCEYPIHTYMREIPLPVPLIYDKTKDKIEVVVAVDGFERRRQRL